MEFDIIKMSSKGQIVIPASMRKNLKEGDSLIVISDDGKLVLKKTESLTEKMKEDIEFAKRTEVAYKRIEAGEYISVDSDNIEKEMMKW